MKRQSTRLDGYDYSQGGTYFVTVCTHQRDALFGGVVDREMVLNDLGSIVQTTWESMPSRFPTISLDQFVIMPNHMHAILFLGAVVEPRVLGTGAAPTLGTVLRAFKSISAIACNRHRGLTGVPVWQRNYHDHVIREGRALESIRRYVFANPAGWATDDVDPVPG